MTCHTCGRQIQNETANFCEYCGASCREKAQAASSTVMGQPFMSRPYTADPVPNMMMGMQQRGALEKPTSLLGWIGMYAILLVPFANIILLMVWAFSDSTPVSKRNWARATLIFLVFLFILIVAYLAAVMSTPLFQQMMQDYGPYYQ